MKVLVLGSGGREHALTWRLSRDPDVASCWPPPEIPGWPGAPVFPCRSQPAGDLFRAQMSRRVVIVHAGTREANGRPVTAGGRVLPVVGRAARYDAAIASAHDKKRERIDRSTDSIYRSM
jgi:phosphoribosylamine-glycine ligase